MAGGSNIYSLYNCTGGHSGIGSKSPKDVPVAGAQCQWQCDAL